MTPDEALKADTDCDCEDCVALTAAAYDVLKLEVERLRAENNVAKIQIEGYEAATKNYGATATEVIQLRAENAALLVLQNTWAMDAAELGWFRRRESEFGPGDFHAFPSTYGRYQDWLKHNPKPGDGT